MINLSVEEIVEGTIEAINKLNKKRVLLQNYHLSDSKEYLKEFKQKIDNIYKIKEIDYITNLFYNQMSDLQLHNALNYEEKRNKKRITLILDPLSKLDGEFLASGLVYQINFGECRGY